MCIIMEPKPGRHMWATDARSLGLPSQAGVYRQSRQPGRADLTVDRRCRGLIIADLRLRVFSVRSSRSESRTRCLALASKSHSDSGPSGCYHLENKMQHVKISLRRALGPRIGPKFGPSAAFGPNFGPNRALGPNSDSGQVILTTTCSVGRTQLLRIWVGGRPTRTRSD